MEGEEARSETELRQQPELSLAVERKAPAGHGRGCVDVCSTDREIDTAENDDDDDDVSGASVGCRRRRSDTHRRQ